MKTGERMNENQDKKIMAILAIALFNFIFLGTEYLFDNMMAYVVDSEGVVLAQSYILGASVVVLCFLVRSTALCRSIGSSFVSWEAPALLLSVFFWWSSMHLMKQY